MEENNVAQVATESTPAPAAAPAKKPYKRMSKKKVWQLCKPIQQKPT